MEQTVIQYVLSRLNSIGISDVFGVPGDYSFPINREICDDKRFRWIGTCNELNASYAAGGYARLKGLAALCTTQGVGELSAINGIAGAFSEHLPIFHLIGMQPSTTWQSHVLMHHTVKNEAHDIFFKMSALVYCAQAILTPENCVSELERLIDAALYNWRPVYIGIPEDYASSMIPRNVSTTKNSMSTKSDPTALNAVVKAIVEAVQKARTACIFPGILISRLGLQDTALALLKASGLVFASTPMDKGVLDEMYPSYIGIYFGHYGDPKVHSFVESCDCIINLGVVMETEINTGRLTSQLDSSKIIDIMHHHVRIGSSVFQGLEIKEVMQELAKHLPRRTGIKPLPVRTLGTPKGNQDDPIKVEYLFPRWAQFFKPRDTIIVDVGTAFLPLIYARLPTRATFHSSSLWASIGWATPAAFGADLSHSERRRRRTVLITGEGAHQMSVQEISQFPRHGLKPIIFVLNNGGYLIERIKGGPKIDTCNDVASWRYQELPKAFGCWDWFTAKVTTCGELDQAMRRIENCDTGVYIEIVTGREFAAIMSEFYRSGIQLLF
jgi:indolepyruvate decarboxylase